ncbi:SpoIIE family protein phosphatase [Acidobacteria bacterium AH-259-O06]|nr:SpoIIE family protein phosphatase [Acidobacteria bacterium AH-259-O06]
MRQLFDPLYEMLKFTKISAILFIVGALIGLYAPASFFNILEGIGFVGLLVSLVYYGYGLLKWLKRRLLWKVRNKVIISYAFVGIIPVLILAFIGWFASRLVLGQLSALYLEDELEAISEILHSVNERIVLDFYEQDVQTQTNLSSLLQAAQENLPPKTSLRLLRPEQQSAVRTPSEGDLRPVQTVLAVPQETSDQSAPLVIPDWIREGFYGLVRDSGSLYFRSVVPVKVGESPFLVFLELPFDQDLMTEITQRTSIHVATFQIPRGSDSSEANLEAEFSLWDFFSRQEQVANILWIHPLSPVDWISGRKLSQTVEGVVLSVPLWTLYDHYFTETVGLGPFVLYWIAILGIMFVIVEAVSFFIGVAIARSITRSIHNIYAGTRNIQKGNFDFRIPNQNRDQLDSMAGAFNSMAESIVQLMAEVSEREWLEKEIEIAREVQAQLFPQRPPSVVGLQLAGTCLPARRVSGDYYDFIPYGENRMDTIIADISGKGISAALLMAGLQSSVRTHIIYSSMQSDGVSEISGAVSEINRQMYLQTPPDKFATLVLTRIDTEKLTLTYCNAGHNPPLLLSNGEIRLLTKGGTVAGLFEDREYEEETLQLHHNDLVVFYTDGVVESEDVNSEQFGEDRLIELVRMNSFLTAEDIQTLILDQVSTWVGQGDQKDDITVVVLKVEKETGNRGLPFPRD